MAWRIRKDLSGPPPEIPLVPRALVKYTRLTTGIGTVFLAATEKGICLLDVETDEAEFRNRLRKSFGEIPVRDDVALAPLSEQLRQYLQGKKLHFTGPFDLRGTPFQLKVWNHLLSIPRRVVRTYKEVAEAIGRPRAYRAVGGAVAANPIPLIVPCHRVVASGGRLGGYSLGLGLKRKLLGMEGYQGRLRD